MNGNKPDENSSATTSSTLASATIIHGLKRCGCAGTAPFAAVRDGVPPLLPPVAPTAVLAGKYTGQGIAEHRADCRAGLERPFGAVAARAGCDRDVRRGGIASASIWRGARVGSGSWAIATPISSNASAQGSSAAYLPSDSTLAIRQQGTVIAVP